MPTSNRGPMAIFICVIYGPNCVNQLSDLGLVAWSGTREANSKSIGNIRCELGAAPAATRPAEVR